MSEETLITVFQSLSDNMLKTWRSEVIFTRDEKISKGSKEEVVFWNKIADLILQERYARQRQVRMLEAAFNKSPHCDPSL